MVKNSMSDVAEDALELRRRIEILEKEGILSAKESERFREEIQELTKNGTGKDPASARGEVDEEPEPVVAALVLCGEYLYYQTASGDRIKEESTCSPEAAVLAAKNLDVGCHDDAGFVLWSPVHETREALTVKMYRNDARSMRNLITDWLDKPSEAGELFICSPMFRYGNIFKMYKRT